MKKHKDLFGVIFLVVCAVAYIWLSEFTPDFMRDMFENTYMTHSDVAAMDK